jgi:transcriptional regulator
MYVPAQFEVTDRSWVTELIGRHPFGLLITGDAEYPRVSHIPMIAQERDGELWLLGHVARENEHARSIVAGAPATLVFAGPQAYVSASWYEEPYATVPTWNYMAAHICGKLRKCDPWPMLKLLSAKLEGHGDRAWDPDRLDSAFVGRQLRAIVGFELHAEIVYAKAKLSQNRTDADRMRVAQKLGASRDQNERETGEAMSNLAALERAARRRQSS